MVPRVSRRRFLAGGAALALSGAVGSVSALYTDDGDPTTRPAIIGHRGAAGLAPANTLAAIDRGLAYDVDAIELDVRQTSDGRLVLFHDPLLDWATDGHGWVHETPWRELTDVRFDGEAIPTLDAGLERLAGTDVDIYLEAKRVGYTDAIIDAVAAHGLRDRLTITSFKPPALEAAFARDVPAGLLGEIPSPDLVDAAVTFGAASVSSHYVPRATPWFIDRATDAGVTGGIWHLTETERVLADCLEAEPGYITTNRPDIALEVLRRA